MTHAEMAMAIELQERFRLANRPDAELALKYLLRDAQEGDRQAAGYLALCLACYGLGRTDGASGASAATPMPAPGVQG